MLALNVEGKIFFSFFNITHNDQLIPITVMFIHIKLLVIVRIFLFTFFIRFYMVSEVNVSRLHMM